MPKVLYSWLILCCIITDILGADSNDSCKYGSWSYYTLEIVSGNYRLKANIESTISSSKTHLEIISLLRVISSHAINTSRMLISSKETKKNN